MDRGGAIKRNPHDPLATVPGADSKRVPHSRKVEFKAPFKQWAIRANSNLRTNAVAAAEEPFPAKQDPISQFLMFDVTMMNSLTVDHLDVAPFRARNAVE